MQGDVEYLKLISNKMDELFGKTFCFAKWYHTNIYFQTGETHSCYHPAPHKISTEKIKLDPSALHNTNEKILERKEMLQSKRPKGCQYCWNIEDLQKNLLSDRHIRTGYLYDEQNVKEIQSNSEDFHVVPSYAEISFSNLCNFKCGYCHPKASSRYYNEIEQFGPYRNVKNHGCDISSLELYQEEDNPYIKAWWAWWPQLSQKLRILRITGGEPLMQKSTFKMFQVLEQTDNSLLELNVNSNMGVSNSIVENFSIKVQSLCDNNKIKSFRLFTSADCWGKQLEYVRYGLDIQAFEKNLNTYLEITNLPLTLMITFNIFSIFSFEKLLVKILDLRQQYQSHTLNSAGFHRITFDISYLKEPLQFDINILPKADFLPYLEKCAMFIKENLDDASKLKFTSLEYQRFLRVLEYMKGTIYPEDKITEGRRDFYLFFKEYDKRKKLNLIEVFPELAAFNQGCENLVIATREG